MPQNIKNCKCSVCANIDVASNVGGRHVILAHTGDSVFEKTIKIDRNIRLIVEDIEESINVQK